MPLIAEILFTLRKVFAFNGCENMRPTKRNRNAARKSGDPNELQVEEHRRSAVGQARKHRTTCWLRLEAACFAAARARRAADSFHNGKVMHILWYGNAEARQICKLCSRSGKCNFPLARNLLTFSSLYGRELCLPTSTMAF